MENKYYSPSIEEFRVGFRYELLKNDEWIAEVVSEDTITLGDYDRNTDLYPILYNHVKVRVKYLAKSDIEELGWLSCGYDKDGRTFDIYNLTINNCDYYLKDYAAHGYNDIKIMKMIENSSKCLFHGTIKNYNELEMIMKMLGVC